MCIADVLWVHGVARGSAGNAETLPGPGGECPYTDTALKLPGICSSPLRRSKAKEDHCK